MPDPAQRHHHRYKLLYVSSAQRRPEGDGARLHELRDEETKPVPNDRDGESGSKSPCAVTARKNDDSSVDQGLHEVEKGVREQQSPIREAPQGKAPLLNRSTSVSNRRRSADH